MIQSAVRSRARHTLAALSLSLSGVLRSQFYCLTLKLFKLAKTRTRSATISTSVVMENHKSIIIGGGQYFYYLYTMDIIAPQFITKYRYIDIRDL